MFALLSRSARHFHSQKPVGRLLLSYKPPQPVQDNSNTVIEQTKTQRKYQINQAALTDAQVLNLLENGEMSQHQLEVALQDTRRAVELRRQFFAKKIASIQLKNMNNDA